LGALEFGALVVPAVRVATAVEDATTGLVRVIVSDTDGNSTLQMISDVTTELENWRCAGIPVSVVGGTQLLVPISVTLTLLPGTAIANMIAPVQAALDARLDKLPAGDGTATGLGVLRLEIITSATICVDVDRILGVTILDPLANVVPTLGQVIRAGAITVAEA
jgi:hypothetical protein